MFLPLSLLFHLFHCGCAFLKPHTVPQCFTLQCVKPFVKPLFSTVSNNSFPSITPSITPSAVSLISEIPKVGIPLNLFSLFFTYSHYGMNILTFKMVILQFLIGFYTYGKDKLKDAHEFREETGVLSPRKKELYAILLENEDFYHRAFQSAYFSILLILFNFENDAFVAVQCVALYESIKFFIANNRFPPFLFSSNCSLIRGIVVLSTFLTVAMFQNGLLCIFPFILLLDVSDQYIGLKQKYGLLKPFLIGGFWVSSVLFLPCVIHDGGFQQILASPNSYIHPFLTVVAVSNLADLKDVEEDTKAGIQTIPVVFGKGGAGLFSLVILGGSLFIIGGENGEWVKDATEFISEPGVGVIKFISSSLPYFDTVGHSLLRANNEFITYILNTDLTPVVKEEIILGSIRLAQLCDNTGSVMLQFYYDIVSACFR